MHRLLGVLLWWLGLGAVPVLVLLVVVVSLIRAHTIVILQYVLDVHLALHSMFVVAAVNVVHPCRSFAWVLPGRRLRQLSPRRLPACAFTCAFLDL